MVSPPVVRSGCPASRRSIAVQPVAVQLDGARAAPFLFEGGEPQGGHVTDPCVRGDGASGVCPRPIAQRFDERSGRPGLRLPDALDGPCPSVEVPIQSPHPKSGGRSVDPDAPYVPNGRVGLLGITRRWIRCRIPGAGARDIGPRVSVPCWTTNSSIHAPPIHRPQLYPPI